MTSSSSSSSSSSSFPSKPSSAWKCSRSARGALFVVFVFAMAKSTFALGEGTKGAEVVGKSSDTKVDDVVVLTPEKRHAYDQFVKYDDAKGQLYILEDLEVDKSYELRASYSAKTPGKVSVVLVSSQRERREEGEKEEGKKESLRRRRKGRKLLDVEKIAFKVSNHDDESKNTGMRATQLFFSSSSSSSSTFDTTPSTKRRAYARVSVDSSNVVPTNGYKKFPHEGVTFNLTLEECFFFGLIPIHSIPAIALCVAMVAFGILIGKPFAAFLWREDFALAKTLSSSTKRHKKK